MRTLQKNCANFLRTPFPVINFSKPRTSVTTFLNVFRVMDRDLPSTDSPRAEDHADRIAPGFSGAQPEATAPPLARGRRAQRRVGRTRPSVRSRGTPGQARSSGSVPSSEAENPSTRRSRGFALTVHFPDGGDHLVNAVFDRIGVDPRIAYCCMQFETCPETGRRHAQGYLHWKSSARFSAVRDFFAGEPSESGVRPHIEVAIASAASNREYCSKPDSAVPNTFREWGTLPYGQGSRYAYNIEVFFATYILVCFFVCIYMLTV